MELFNVRQNASMSGLWISPHRHIFGPKINMVGGNSEDYCCYLNDHNNLDDLQNLV